MNFVNSPSIRRVFRGTNYRTNVVPWTRVEINPEVAALLSNPTWSVRSLLPSHDQLEILEVSRDQLHHLLKLSALPSPKTREAEDRMLRTLQSQIHFVREVQRVNTSVVEPLVAIRDETAEAIKENTITLEKLRPHLDLEKKVGPNGTVRRPKSTEMIKHSGWDPFAMGEGIETRKTGKYFFVKKNKNSTQNG